MKEPAAPLPWVHYSAPLRPQYPTQVNEIHRANDGPTVVQWGGFDAADGSKAARKKNAAYIVHACNAYPRLVEAMLLLVRRPDQNRALRTDQLLARNLLHELGELKRQSGDQERE